MMGIHDSNTNRSMLRSKRMVMIAGFAAIILIGGLLYMNRQTGGTAEAVPYNGIGGTFKNTLADFDTPDPSIAYKDGFYYMTFTHHGADIMVLKSRTLDFREAESKIVWYPPVGTRYSSNLWAPEIQFIGDKWYIYFAADDGHNENHRMYALEAVSDDPLGEYEFKGQITDDTDKWAIDGLALELDGQLYFVWSGWEGDVNIEQLTYIAPMSDPVTISGPRVLIGSPDQEWERLGGPPYIHEGQAILKKDGRTFIAYSGAGSWTPYYSIGALALEPGADPLDPASWTKLPRPLMTMNEEGGVFGPGHNTFALSPDGTEIWNVYHATSGFYDGWNNRKARAARVEWEENGEPVFGVPTPLEEAIPVPSGTGLIKAEHGSKDGDRLTFDGFYSAIDTEAVVLLQYRNRTGAEAAASISAGGSGSDESTVITLPVTGEDEIGYAYGILPLRKGHQALIVEAAPSVEIVAIERPKLEAENAAVLGDSDMQDHPDFSGGRSVYMAAGEEKAVAFENIHVPVSGKYLLRISAANLSEGGSELVVSIDGGKPRKLAIPEGGRGELRVAELEAELKSGGHTITLGSVSSAIQLDRIEIMKILNK